MSVSPDLSFPQFSNRAWSVKSFAIRLSVHFGLTNLRTIQEWVVTRRLMAIPGVVAINSWGGTTKQFQVDVDSQKLEAYNITVPQLVTAIGNANTMSAPVRLRSGNDL
jgi:heavy metal efflux system protein